uniref:Ovary development-related protein n=1 Tax=Eriocheir sinensis TaxID=95602 RepID=Q5QKR2_ERISI|nr:ovary development-related protein [Eriocheir sinensis]
MWCSILLAAVMVAVAGGQSRFSYDGTPLADDVVVGSGQRQQFFASRQPRPQQLFVQERPQQVFVQQQPQPPVFVQPEPQQVFVQPQPRPMFQMLPSFSQQAAVIQSVQPQVSSACPATYSLVHTTYQGRVYHSSWCNLPGHRFSQSAARDYCRGLGEVTVMNRRGSFDLYSVDRTTDFDYFFELLLQHQIPSVWTRDLASTAPYEIRGSITRSGDSTAGQDCLSLEASTDGLFLLQDSCSDRKAAVCVAHWQ